MDWVFLYMGSTSMCDIPFKAACKNNSSELIRLKSTPAFPVEFHDPARWGVGIALAVAAMASLSISDATSKWVMLSVTPVMVLWFRYAVQAVGTALVLAPLRGRAMWRTHSLRWQLLRGLLMVSCSLLAFYCLQRMPVAEFTATVMLTPLVLTALARFVMKEQVSPLRWLMVVGGLIGALLVIRPGGQVDPSVSWMAMAVVPFSFFSARRDG
jgi:drug/metabolite transporter (DMT)-like permease